MRIFKIATLAVTISVLAACGDISNNKKDKDANWSPELKPCGATFEKSVSCVPSANWHIVMTSDGYPERSLIKIKDRVVLDECSSEVNIFSVERTTLINIIADDFVYIPAGNELSIEIVDKGFDCSGSKVFYKNDNQEYHPAIEGDNHFVYIEIL